MPFDALTYKAAARELDSALSGGRIERVGMPDKDDVLLYVRTPAERGRQSKTLLIGCNPSHPRIHLTTETAENPLSAYAFLMHLRRRISGGLIKSICSVPHERIIRISVEAGDELGYKREFSLYAELVGRYPNLILADADGKITDSLRHISYDDFSRRAVLPELPYLPPPAQEGKLPPDDIGGVTEKLLAFSGGDLAGYMMKCVYGYAPVTMREIVFRAYGESPSAEEVHAHPERFFSAAKELGDAYSPCAAVQDGKIREIFVTPYLHLGEETKPYPTLSEAADALYSDMEKAGYMAGKTAHLTAVVKNAIKKNARSLALYREQELAARDFEEERIRGELVTANIYRIKQGDRTLTADNYYTGKSEVIALDPTLSPQKNAQKFFKAYNKKKTALHKSAEQAAAAEERAEYYETLLLALASAENENDIAEISAEMAGAGLIRQPAVKRKPRPSKPRKFETEGITLFVGKNNVQNDALVRTSQGGWIWLHVKDIHGSHGVLCSSDPPETALVRAAEIVAYFSKAAMSDNVPVDYTLVKFVKKPAHALPGKVIYTHQRTLYVTPKKP